MNPPPQQDIQPQKTIIIAAHPDDEILWFSPVLDKADAVVICFLDIPTDPAISEGRRRCISGYPALNVKWLEIEEAGCAGLADWRKPLPTRYGVGIHNRGAACKYRKNFGRLVALLKTILPGYTVIYTHNPWGEYGHEEHVQVYRAVKHVCNELNGEQSIWCPGYVSNRSAALMAYYQSIFQNPSRIFKTGKRVPGLKRLYQKHGCWTWFSDWQWPAEEIFLMDGPGKYEDGLAAGCQTARRLPVQLIMLSE